VENMTRVSALIDLAKDAHTLRLEEEVNLMKNHIFGMITTQYPFLRDSSIFILSRLTPRT